MRSLRMESIMLDMFRIAVVFFGAVYMDMIRPSPSHPVPCLCWVSPFRISSEVVQDFGLFCLLIVSITDSVLTFTTSCFCAYLQKGKSDCSVIVVDVYAWTRFRLLSLDRCAKERIRKFGVVKEGRGETANRCAPKKLTFAEQRAHSVTTSFRHSTLPDPTGLGRSGRGERGSHVGRMMACCAARLRSMQCWGAVCGWMDIDEGQLAH
uniref:DUF4220 domain-containing protein n=1 Tax=Setaria digitata TaxID=48799 RepID=A0A915Q4B3_9BILA